MSDRRGTAQAVQRRTVLYGGQVQGVGFRYRACQIAANYAVVGHVRNLSDGRVELVAEGASGEVERFLADIAESLKLHIRQTWVDVSAASGEYSDFGVRHG